MCAPSHLLLMFSQTVYDGVKREREQMLSQKRMTHYYYIEIRDCINYLITPDRRDLFLPSQV